MASLPAKENSLFKRVIKCYEQKQYRQGLKFCRQILSQKAYKDHGETLAMKGLLLNSLGKRDEAMECVKAGIRSALKSPICWHVYGLLLKSEEKYEEAIKCYQRALTFEKDNLQILRDLSLDQIHIRNYTGYRNTRFQLLKLRPNQRISWLGYITGLHLLGNYKEAIHVMHEFLSCQQTVNPYDYEHSEVIMYCAQLIWESGRYDDLSKFLQSNMKAIVDIKSLKELQGRVYEALHNKEDALRVYEELMDRNPDNREYYRAIERLKSFSSVEERLKFYDDIVSRYPRAALPRRIPLEFLEGEIFYQRADQFVRNGLQKGIPTLFAQLRHLYTKESPRIQQLEQIFNDYYLSLRAKAAIDVRSSHCNGVLNENDGDHDAQIELEPPSTRTWAAYLLAQHLCHVGRFEEALKLAIDELSFAPTLVEWYSLIASIYSAAGDPLLASEWMIEAQSLDTADRYINSQCVRALIEADRLQEASEMAAKFTREGSSSFEYLDEMQCMWFLTSTARMHYRLGQYGDALKRCHEIYRHFHTIVEDQLDFHNYCLRRGSLRAYTHMLRVEDTLHHHSYYFDGAKIAIETYTNLHDHPIKENDQADDEKIANMSKEELKKFRNRQRKERRKAEQEAAKQRAEQEKKEAALRARGNDANDGEKVNNQDQVKFDPIKLSKTETPLVDATKFLEPLLRLSGDRLETHCLAYEIYSRKERVLLMLSSILHGSRVDKCLEDPHYHQCLCHFVLNWRRIVQSKLSVENGLNDALSQEKWQLALNLIESQLISLSFGNGTAKYDLLSSAAPTVVQINDWFLKHCGNRSLIHYLAAFKVRCILDSTLKTKSAHDLVTSIDLDSFKQLNHEDATTFVTILSGYAATPDENSQIAVLSSSEVDSLRCKLSTRFPYCRSLFDADKRSMLSPEQQDLPVVCPTPTSIRPLNSCKSSSMQGEIVENGQTQDSI